MATVSGCGGDFLDLHNLSLLSVGLSVTPAIISGLVPWYDFDIISVIVAVAFCKAFLITEAVFLPCSFLNISGPKKRGFLFSLH